MTDTVFRQTVRRLAAGLLLLGLALASGPAWAKCELGRVADLPVTMFGGRPLMAADIDGKPVELVVGSGSFYSIITSANADRLNLPRQPLRFGTFIHSGTGDINAEVGMVRVLTLAGQPLYDTQFLVGGGEVGGRAVGTLGQNVLGAWDVEYDLAEGMVRLWSPRGCGDSGNLAYWSATPTSVVDLDLNYFERRVRYTRAPVYVNGVRLIAKFSSGSTGSIMTMDAAARVGITPNSPGVVVGGTWRSLAKRTTKVWIAPIKSFKIGREVIQNTRLRIGDIDPSNADLVLGADFFLAHHIFVSNSQHKLYLSYNGGPVFDLTRSPIPVADATPSPLPDAAAADPANAAPAQADPVQADPTDAAGFARRGSAFAARKDLASAIADLGKAIQLAPTVPDYLYQRGLYYGRDNQPALAMADFDAALKLKPDDAPALVARAALRLSRHDRLHAVEDLDAADKVLAKEDDARLQVANLYASADLRESAIDQFNLWIDAHSEDSRLPDALNGRCWQRALLGVDLDKALNDCNRAIRTAPKTATMLDSRGLVHLRLGDLDKAIADYDAALAINPTIEWSLYGRGLAKQRKGLTAEGAADVAAATAINPKLADEVRTHGLTP